MDRIFKNSIVFTKSEYNKFKANEKINTFIKLENDKKFKKATIPLSWLTDRDFIKEYFSIDKFSENTVENVFSDSLVFDEKTKDWVFVEKTTTDTDKKDVKQKEGLYDGIKGRVVKFNNERHLILHNPYADCVTMSYIVSEGGRGGFETQHLKGALMVISVQDNGEFDNIIDKNVKMVLELLNSLDVTKKELSYVVWCLMVSYVGEHTISNK